MTAGIEALGFGAVLGFSLAMPPGPMNAWIAAIAARSYRAGVITGLGAMAADGLVATAVYLADRIVDVHAVLWAVYLLGAAVMAFLGVRLLRAPSVDAPPLPDEQTFVRALGIGLSNPFQLVWWLTAGLAFAYLGGVTLLVGLFGAILVWVFGFPWAVRTGVRRRPAVGPLIRLASAGILLAFAAYFVFLFSVS